MVRIAMPVFSADKFKNYFAALNAFGAEGVIIGANADPSGFDGLLLPGGGDVNPARYGQEMAGSNPPDEALDALQLAAAKRFDLAGKVMFGICRGHQVLNVYYGGTLIQHLPTSETHQTLEGQPRDKIHPSRANPGSWLETLYGSDFVVNSAHHQAVDRPGSGLVIDQYAEDGVIEGMHHENGRVFSVQWHPERMCLAHRHEDTADGSLVLRFFLERCLR